MKSVIPTIITTAGLAWAAAIPIFAQDAPAPVAPPTLTESEVQRQLEQAQAHVERELAKVGQAIELAQAAVEAQVAQAVPPVAPEAPDAPSLHTRLARLVRRGPSKTLVIRSSPMEPAGQANLEEDLAVMSRVFERALEQNLGEDDARRTASGIGVFFSPEGGSMRNVYLDGYGALFMLNVRFPLLAPATKKVEEKPKEETDSTWDAARREIYGKKGGWDEEFGDTFKHKAFGHEPQEYDARKVEKLKQALLEAFKSATNIRHLKSDESITVCVFGGVSTGPAKVSAVRRFERDSGVRKRGDDKDQVVVVNSREETGPRGTVMTIRVKKSDVDVFAKGKLELEEFVRKASVTSYAADTGAWGGGGAFGLGY